MPKRVRAFAIEITTLPDSSSATDAAVVAAASHGVALLAAEPDLTSMLLEWFQRMLGVN